MSDQRKNATQNLVWQRLFIKQDAEIQKKEQELRKVLAEKVKIKGENLLKKSRE